MLNPGEFCYVKVNQKQLFKNAKGYYVDEILCEKWREEYKVELGVGFHIDLEFYFVDSQDNLHIKPLGYIQFGETDIQELVTQLSQSESRIKTLINKA